MCDINAVLQTSAGEEKLMENVDLAQETADGIRLVNIFGEERCVAGRIVHYHNSAKKMIIRAD